MCRECAHLGKDELEFRSIQNDVSRAMRDHSLVPRKHRGFIEGLLAHSNARVRDLAQNILEHHANVKAQLIAARQAREAEEERLLLELPDAELDYDDIPF